MQNDGIILELEGLAAAQMALPPGFVDLITAYKKPPNTLVNIVGVVVDLMEPAQTRTNSWMVTFNLLDLGLQRAIHGFQGLAIRCFHEDRDKLPQVRERGDVVLLRSVKMFNFGGQPIAMFNYSTQALIFPAKSIPKPDYSIAYLGDNRLLCMGVPAHVETLSTAEQQYVIQLKNEFDATSHLLRTNVPEQRKRREMGPPAAPTPPDKRARTSEVGPKYRLIRDLQHKTYVDIVAQVVKKFSGMFDTCELYVTDYTENKDMWYYKPPEDLTESERDGDTYGYNRPAKKDWPGPYGWLVLKVNLKGPHARFANTSVNEGDYVLLRNVKMKIMAEGAKLEGDMWPDDLAPERNKVWKLAQDAYPEIGSLLTRKDKYWAKRRQQHPELYPLAGKAGAPVLSRKERKQMRKREREAEKAKAEAKAAAALERNRHIRCSNEEIPLLPISKILDPSDERHTNILPDGQSYVIPFINAQYRTKAHVVDFEPKDLADFAIPEIPEAAGPDDSTSPIDVMDYELSNTQTAWTWYFSLLLEDALTPSTTNEEKPRLWVHVRHEDAQFLFGNSLDDPCDLRQNPEMLGKLKEKLCILWGDLEEKKTTGNQQQQEQQQRQGVSNRPFECCIQEYGIELDEGDPERENAVLGYKRLYRMFGTTIL